MFCALNFCYFLTYQGLVVPVIRNVENMSFMDVERKLGELAAKAKDDAITVEDMTGGTFTISNGGMYCPQCKCDTFAGVFGSLMGTPILNPPQAAILGMHGINDRPIAINGQV